MKPSSVDALSARRLGLAWPPDRERIETARMEALRSTVAHARQKSSWYRERLAGLDPDCLRSCDDLARLPFLNGADLAAHGRELLCVSQSEVARIITLQTSGSTGVPKRLHFTREDLDSTVDFFQQGMFSLISSQDRVLALLPFSLPDSTGDLLIRALAKGGVHCEGVWPPADWEALARRVRDENFTSIVGLPQHLLALAYELPHGLVRTMLLCSDYAPQSLRTRIEEACGSETFLHYGTTETGLGGGVECQAHGGCHMRESDLLIEIVDLRTGAPVPEGEVGEVVVTTLNRQAMPLLRYRTGDLASLDTSPCLCGGVTARLCDIRGRRKACPIAGGYSVASQDLDDALFALDGLLDYRASLTRSAGRDAISVEFLARPGHERLEREIHRALKSVPALNMAMQSLTFEAGPALRVESFSPSHTLKRTILDNRGSCS
jgi:phenylacetate-coenzyme A ligase PaaK-like adenylate-forming protein